MVKAVIKPKKQIFILIRVFYAVMPKKTAGVSSSDEFGMNKMINKSAETPECKLGEVHYKTRICQGEISTCKKWTGTIIFIYGKMPVPFP